jgi:hypothetical protein
MITGKNAIKVVLFEMVDRIILHEEVSRFIVRKSPEISRVAWVPNW